MKREQDKKGIKVHTKDFESFLHIIYGVGTIINEFGINNKNGFKIVTEYNPKAEFTRIELMGLDP